MKDALLWRRPSLGWVLDVFSIGRRYTGAGLHAAIRLDMGSHEKPSPYCPIMACTALQHFTANG